MYIQEDNKKIHGVLNIVFLNLYLLKYDMHI